LAEVLLGQRVSQWNEFLTPNGDLACHYRGLQAIAEQYLGKNLTATQINALTKGLVDSGAMTDSYWVSNPEVIVNSAFAALGRPDVTAAWAGTQSPSRPAPGAADASVRRVVTEFGMAQNGSQHSQLGDAKGHFVWDPYYGKSDMTTQHLRTYYFDINEPRRLDFNGR